MIFLLLLSLSLFSMVYGSFMKRIWLEGHCEHGPKLQNVSYATLPGDTKINTNIWHFEYRQKGRYVNGTYVI